MQSAATSMAGFLVNCSSAAVELETKAESEPPTSLAGNLYGVDGLGKIWFAHPRASVCTLLLHAPGLVSCVRQHASCQPCTQLFGSCLRFAVLKNNLSAGRVRVHTSFECYNKRGYTRTWYVYQHFLFDFPFDEIYRHLLFFTLGRSFSA